MSEIINSPADTVQEQRIGQDGKSLADELFSSVGHQPEADLDVFPPPHIGIQTTGEAGENVPDLIPIQGRFTHANLLARRLSEAGAGTSLAHQICTNELSQESKAHIGTVLEAWQLADSNFFFMHARPEKYLKSHLKEQWDELAMRQLENLGAILGVDFDDLAIEYFTNDEQPPEGLAAIKHLLADSEFTPRAQLASFVMRAGWRAKATFFRSDPYREGKKYGMARYFYEYTKLECNELLRDVAIVFAQEGNFDQVGKIFDHFAFSDVPVEGQFKPEDFPSALEDARSVLLDSRFSADQQKGVLREFVKVYGPIQAVDTLSSAFKSLIAAGLTETDPYVKSLIALYSLLEGEEVPNPMEKLTDVYELVDYASNERPELTAKEATRLEAVIGIFAQATEYSMVDGEVKEFTNSGQEGSYYGQTDPHAVRILDLGAGNARVSRELYKRGYTRISALEFDPRNARVARQKLADKGFTVIRGDWHKLPFGTSEALKFKDAIQVGFTTERSFLHNRKAAEWFSLFDEFGRVSHPRALLMLDLPDTNSGVYKKRIDTFRENLEHNLNISHIESKIIFDGPGKVKFNRMAITNEQLHIYAKLFGFVIVEEDKDERQEDDMTDVYYVLAKNQNFVFGDIGRQELWDDLYKLGMFDYEVDYNMFVKSWGMTLGQALLFGPDYAGSFQSSLYVHDRFKAERGPRVWADNSGGRLNLRSEWPAYV